MLFARFGFTMKRSVHERSSIRESSHAFPNALFEVIGFVFAFTTDEPPIGLCRVEHAEGGDSLFAE